MCDREPGSSSFGGLDVVQRNRTLILLASLAAVAFSSATASAQAVCTTDLVAWWKGDSDALDSWGAHHGALSGSAGYTAGVVGDAFAFTGGHWIGPDTTPLWPTGDFTVDAWIRTLPQTSRQAVFSMYECGLSCPSGVADSALFLNVAPSGVASGFVRGETAPGEDGVSATGTTIVTDGAFHHLALVRDLTAGEARLYVDGALEATVALNAAAASPMSNDDGSADPVLIGIKRVAGSSAFEQAFTGAIDEVALYHRTLSAGEIGGIYTNGADGRCPEGPGTPIVPVPELGTLLLFGLGAIAIAGTVLVRRRR